MLHKMRVIYSKETKWAGLKFGKLSKDNTDTGKVTQSLQIHKQLTQQCQLFAT